MPLKYSALRNAGDVIPPATAALFAEIRENPLLNPFILIGGTALSIHIGHRVSEDLDFISLLPKLPRVALKELERELTASGHEVMHVVQPEAYEEFLNAGMDLADSSQDWMCHGHPSPHDEGFSSLLKSPPTIGEMQSKFRFLRHGYEADLAKERLGRKS